MSVTRSVLFLSLLGCGGASAVVPTDDPTFARAEARLTSTASIVESTDASPPERALFLQAEALNRYRFSTRTRGGAAFAAEAAAAITDLPVFQSLAGSLDLADLRLRSSDAAVQLYETFLARYPRSSLRPLALYRVGFAYQSAGAAGFPRSGDAAWEELAKSDAPRELVDAAQDARRVRWKSKGTASGWSIVPGLGQFYLEEPVSGAIRLAIALAAAAALVTPTVIGASRVSELSWSHDWPLLAVGAAGLVVLSFDYTSSYEDAMRGVVRWNEREEARFEDAHPSLP